MAASLLLATGSQARAETAETVAVSPARQVAADVAVPEVVAHDPDGHGLLCRLQGQTILLLEGTPEEMGTAHGRLLGAQAKQLTERVLYMVGGLDTLQGNHWFLDRMAQIERRTQPFVPRRFVEECDATARAAGIARRDARYANLFPERFHCSGVAVAGKASRDGRVYHARVLDYMRDINLQGMAAVVVFMPQDFNKWMSLSYAGFIGTVTAMNEHGLAVGEMGGRGEGDWDGMPMSYLLRDVMERASTVEEALEIVRTTPRTCEYYYVFSDRSANMAGVRCTPDQMLVLRPGEQHSLLPRVPDDTVMFSAGTRAEELSRRLQENYGQIDVPSMIEIIKRPVAMSSNLHNAIFAPQSLEMWFANAGKHTPACDEPYTRCNLATLIDFFDEQTGARQVTAARSAGHAGLVQD
jgi:hypothetical protein